jgi:hypothetical protein
MLKAAAAVIRCNTIIGSALQHRLKTALRLRAPLISCDNNLPNALVVDHEPPFPTRLQRGSILDQNTLSVPRGRSRPREFSGGARRRQFRLIAAAKANSVRFDGQNVSTKWDQTALYASPHGHAVPVRALFTDLNVSSDNFQAARKHTSLSTR